MVTMEAIKRRVKGIQLSVEKRQQLIAQYAEDTSFTFSLSPGDLLSGFRSYYQLAKVKQLLESQSHL
jgi:hypothetical protein